MKTHAIKVLPCESNQAGHTVRPYELDGEVIYRMDLVKLMMDEAEQTFEEVDGLLTAIEEKTGVAIPRDQLPLVLKEKTFNGIS